ncbi:hypothetical protein F5879DRAFT_993203 [Lentinula edodes]|nr:hypothetical protein F5879DRAFT_993203 [Lentinula edodes]
MLWHSIINLFHRGYEKEIRPFLTDGQNTIFTTLRQHQKFFTTLALSQPRLSRFNWNIEKTILTFDGFPIPTHLFIEGIHQTIVSVEKKIETLFRGCLYDDVLLHIDNALDPTPSIPKWFLDHPTELRCRYSFFEEPRNGFSELRPRLLNHLKQQAHFFHADGPPKPGGILTWFAELDSIVSDLWTLLHSTWGGSPRATEIAGALYANHPRNTRNFFILNGLPSFFTAYSKTQHIKGHGIGIIRTPAYRVSRLLILVLALPYWAAANLACCIGMAKLNCQRYLYEVFVHTGSSLQSARLSLILGRWTFAKIGCMLQIADFRQYNSTLLVHATQTTLDEPEDVDPEIVATHAQFGHSVNVAHDHYGLEGNQALTRLAADSIARMQKVSRNWHAFIGLLHPLLVKSVNEELQVTDSVFFPNKVLIITQLQLISVSGPPVTKAVLTSELKKTREALQTAVTIKMDHFNEILCKKMEYGYTEIRENLIHIHQTPNFSNPRRTPVHPSTLFALRRALGRNFDGFTSPEQAELIQSVGSSLHVFGIIETGGGKSMAFFAAPHLLPQSLFIVVSPLKALTADLERRLRETGVSGGVWKPDEPMKWESVQLVLASVDHCAGQRFLRYIQNDPIKSRLRRVFFDEAHKIHTDTNFRHCFELIHHLVRTGVPITFLSGSLMPRAIPYILRIMHISDPSIVDEIRRETHRPNLKYIIQKTDEERHFATLKGFIGEKMIQLDSHERGMVFTASKREADMLGSQLGIPVYHSDLPNNARTAAATLWHNGVLPTDRFIAATEAFGAGINEPHVKIVIHSNPRSLINFVQETGRAGRDGDPAHCYTFFHRLPPILSVQETEQYGDPSAQMEMREALQTLHCFRLTFRCMDGKARSCASLPKAQLCSNCEEYAQIPYSCAAAEYPTFNTPLVLQPDSQLMVPLSVKINGQRLDVEYRSADVQLRKLSDILDNVVANGCMDCCPFCRFSTTSETDLESHVAGHRETNFASVTMVVNEISYALTLDRTVGLYQCAAAGCDLRGTLFALWTHFRVAHTSQARKRAPPPLPTRPSKRLRFTQPDSSSSSLESFSSSSSSSSPLTMEAPLSSSNLGGTPSPSLSTAMLSPFCMKQASKNPSLMSSSPLTADVHSPQPPVASMPPEDIRICPTKIFARNARPNMMQEFIHNTMGSIASSCPLHFILFGETPDDHSYLRQCSSPLTANNGEYSLTFADSLTFEKYSACYRCWTPQHPAFEHTFPCKQTDNVQDWWRSMPYFILRVKVIREAVFTTLGLDPNTFKSIKDYSIWLTKRALPPQHPHCSKNFTNLVVLAYTFLRLQTEKALEVPAGGHILDAEAYEGLE